MNAKSLRWLKFAKDDFEVGQATLISFGDRYAGIVAYHAQQAAEKAFKAFLVFNDKFVPKTHNLNVLLDQCDALDSDFKNIWIQADRLNPFSIQTRYPDDICTELTREEAEELLRCSEQIIELVEKKIKS